MAPKDYSQFRHKENSGVVELDFTLDCLHSEGVIESSQRSFLLNLINFS